MELQCLVKKAKAGDRDALVTMIMAEKASYFSLAMVWLGNREEALDAMEDMVVILYSKIHQLKNPESFYPWSKSILVNCCRKRLKARGRVIPMEIPERHYEEQGFEQWEDRLLLEKYLSQLNMKHQEVLKLRYYLDLEYQTIAELLRVPVGTVKSRIHKGLNQLKEWMGGDRNERA